MDTEKIKITLREFEDPSTPMDSEIYERRIRSYHLAPNQFKFPRAEVNLDQIRGELTRDVYYILSVRHITKQNVEEIVDIFPVTRPPEEIYQTTRRVVAQEVQELENLI